MRHISKLMIGVVLIVVLIIGFTLYVKYYLNSQSKLIENDIAAVESSIKAENWQEAYEQLEEMKERWNRIQSTWAIFINHEEIDNIDYTMSRFAEFVKVRQLEFALVEASSLRQYIKHIPENETLSLGNLF